jgi:hypothetical protein
MSDDEVLSLKRVMVKHYQELLAKEIDHVSEKKGYSAGDFDKMLDLKS